MGLCIFSGKKMNDLALALECGASADIWYDASDHADEGAEESINDAQQAMVESAKILRAIASATDAAETKANTSVFERYLVDRIFAVPVPDVEQLLSEIQDVNQMDESNQWRERKHRFNEIATRFPMRDDSPFLLSYKDLPAIFAAEKRAFEGLAGGCNAK